MRSREGTTLAQLTRLLSSSRPALIIFAEVVGGTALSLFSLAIFAYLTSEVMEMETAGIDVRISEMVYSMRTPWLTTVMFAVTSLGSPGTLLVAALILVVLFWKHHKREATLISILLGMALVLNYLVKEIVHRPRPTLEPLAQPVSYSFPSGHAMNSFVFYATLAYLVFHVSHNKLLGIGVSVLAALLVVAIGFSRVYLGVHYPIDVLGGWIGGFWVFVTVMLLDKTLLFFRLFREAERKEG